MVNDNLSLSIADFNKIYEHIVVQAANPNIHASQFNNTMLETLARSLLSIFQEATLGNEIKPIIAINKLTTLMKANFFDSVCSNDSVIALQAVLKETASVKGFLSEVSVKIDNEDYDGETVTERMARILDENIVYDRKSYIPSTIVTGRMTANIRKAVHIEKADDEKSKAEIQDSELLHKKNKEKINHLIAEGEQHLATKQYINAMTCFRNALKEMQELPRKYFDLKEKANLCLCYRRLSFSYFKYAKLMSQVLSSEDIRSYYSLAIVALNKLRTHDFKRDDMLQMAKYNYFAGLHNLLHNKYNLALSNFESAQRHIISANPDYQDCVAFPVQDRMFLNVLDRKLEVLTILANCIQNDTMTTNHYYKAGLDFIHQYGMENVIACNKRIDTFYNNLANYLFERLRCAIMTNSTKEADILCADIIEIGVPFDELLHVIKDVIDEPTIKVAIAENVKWNPYINTMITKIVSDAVDLDQDSYAAVNHIRRTLQNLQFTQSELKLNTNDSEKLDTKSFFITTLNSNQPASNNGKNDAPAETSDYNNFNPKNNN